jgi:two-component system nitrogen regulation sensor histidine kinase GlnL
MVTERRGIDARHLLDALPHPILVIEGQHVVFANASAEDFFRLSAASLSRLSIDDIIPLTSPLHAVLVQARLRPQSINEYAIHVGTPRTGGERLVDVQAATIVDNPGAVLLSIHPRSIAQKLDQQLTHRSSAQTVTGLASMLAHEIKNPLSGIRGAAQLLEPALNTEDKALSQLIQKEADRIRDLVDQMESFSDDRPLHRQAVNIHEVINHVKQLAVSGFARGLRVVEQYDPSLPPVLGDRNLLIQLVLNLVKNAAEAIAGEKVGEIVLATAFRPGVKLSLPGSHERVSLPLEVQICDNGPGVPSSIVPRLFDPFITGKPNGRGLGLALAAKIVRDHFGILEYERRRTLSVFRVLLPTGQPELGASI